MQPSVHLNQRDITRLQTAISRLMAIGEAMLSKNGHAAEAKPKRRRRKRRTSSDAPPAPRGRRPRTPTPPASSPE